VALFDQLKGPKPVVPVGQSGRLGRPKAERIGHGWVGLKNWIGLGNGAISWLSPTYSVPSEGLLGLKSAISRGAKPCHLCHRLVGFQSC
jgi:hypothetical protein